MNEQAKELLAQVRAHLHPESVVALARQLITVPSYTAEGEEQAAVVLEQFLHRAGITTERQQVEDVGVNVIATLPGESEESGLVLNGHLDVVPPSSAMRYPPFEATIAGGCLWGRGAADMKGAVAAMACAFTAVKAAGIPLKRPVTLTAVASEEKGNRGTAALVRQGVRAAWAVVGEPTGLDLVVAHKGVDRYQVVVEGRAVHESLPERGLNAIVQAAHLIAALDSHLLARTKEQTHPVLGQATYNIGTIEGGISRNMVPDRCMFRLGKRWLPGDSPEAIRAEIEAVIRAARLEAHISLLREPDMERVPHPPLELEPDHPLTRTLAAAVTSVTGQPPALLGWAAFTDGALLQAAGVPSIIFGPGDLSLAHSDEEHIQLSELVTAAEIYAAFTMMACTDRPG